jgi:uncharacterized membrane protein
MQTATPTFRKAAKKRGFILAAVLCLVLALALSACSSSKDTAGTGTPDSSSGPAGKADTGSQEIKSEEGLVISISDISETPTFYPVTVDGTRMEVFAVKASDGTIRTAFNTCQVCNGSPKAYFKVSGTSVQCQNCGNKFAISKIGLEAGGCNPVPILDTDKTVTDEAVTIPYDTLQTNAYRFPANWKK